MSQSFSERLKALRSARGLSQRALADRLNLSHGTIGMYESGQREPDHDLLDRLAKEFAVSVDFLLGRSDDPSPDEDPFFYFLRGAGLTEDDKAAILNLLTIRRLQREKSQP